MTSCSWRWSLLAAPLALAIGGDHRPPGHDAGHRTAARVAMLPSLVLLAVSLARRGSG